MFDIFFVGARHASPLLALPKGRSKQRPYTMMLNIYCSHQ